MHPIRSYVVRFYRRDRRVVAGLVEDVRTGRSTPFRSFADLLAVLRGRGRSTPVAPVPADPHFIEPSKEIQP